MRDYFISYATPDMPWADWIAWEIESSGYDVMMQRWDFTPGANFVSEMQKATTSCRKVIIILSANFLASKFVTAEWASFFEMDSDGNKKMIVPIRVSECSPNGLLKQILYIDLVGVDANTAKRRLLEGLKPGRRKPQIPPPFPGVPIPIVSRPPKFPGTQASGIANTPSRETSLSWSDLRKRQQLKKLPTIRKRQVGRSFTIHDLSSLISELINHERELRAITIDVDGMTGINARYGVDVGDSVIERLIFFCEEIPARFVVVRIGDDTLLVILRGCTEQQCYDLSVGLLDTISKYDWSAIAVGLFVHCSAGISSFSPGRDAFETVLGGQAALRLARRFGGNRVMFERDLDAQQRGEILLRSIQRQMEDS